MSDPFDFFPTKKYAVMGNPVAHSKSPQIHRAFAQSCGVRLEYTAIQVDAGGFVQAVDQFRAQGGAGLNVTVPYKLEAHALATRLSDRARAAGAVNTLKFQPAEIFGDNTDGVGMVRDIEQNLQRVIRGQRVLIVGAGGAVRGVLGPLLAAAPAEVVIANRTRAKAEELAALFGEVRAAGQLRAAGLADANDDVRGFDIVINGTAASLKGEVPALPPQVFAPGALAYDMMYGTERTPFLQWASTNGVAQLADGLGMLVEQAAESFFIWHGRRPATAPVLQTLRAQK